MKKAIKNKTKQYNSLKYNTKQFIKIQYNSLKYNTKQFIKIQYNSLKYNTIN